MESKGVLWSNELDFIHEISLTHKLQETTKWGQPCFTFNGKNIFIFGSFKHSCVISFFKGALLKDPKSLLQKAGENSQGTTVLRFGSVEDIKAIQEEIHDFIRQAIKIEVNGTKSMMPSTKQEIPVELQIRFEESPELHAAFYALTPGRQRGYLIYFSSAKHSDTRKNRIDKMKPRILSGQGIDDCICGLSKRMPRCDGSHKFV